jgi:hypothetical protein
MMFPFPKLAVAVALTVAWPNDPVEVPSGFWTGNYYLQQPEGPRLAYVIGLSDGLLLAPLLGGDQDAARRLKDCMRGMNAGQIMAIFEKHLRDNPRNWQDDANGLFYQAMVQACPSVVPRKQRQ